MTVLKMKVDNTWLPVGAGPTMPPGGTTGQVLTKASAADYATAWGTNQPILANSTYLQGYQADGTTAQNLVGVYTDNTIRVAPSAPTNVEVGSSASGDLHVGLNAVGTIYLGYGAQNNIAIGSGLAAGKNIYVPRLTVQGPLTLQDQQAVVASNGMGILTPWISKVTFATNCDAWFNEFAGESWFLRNVQIYGTLYKGGTGVAYTHPDFVFEHAFTGGIERFRDAPGADTYEGLWPLARVEKFAQEHWRLPGHAPREDDRVDIFRRTHDLLAECERIYLHLFEHERRLAALEER